MIQLYDYFRSSACFRVRIALHLKNIEYKKIPIHLVNNGGEQFQSSYEALNPQQLVPTLIDHNHVLTQSLAIIEYLDELYPEPALLPKNIYEKAWVRSFALTIAADIHPLNNLRVLKFLTHDLHLSEEQKNKWYQHWVAKGLDALEKKLNTSSYTGDYCFGNQPSLADIFLVPQMFNAKRFNCPLDSYPTLVRIDSHCLKHPAFTESQPIEV